MPTFNESNLKRNSKKFLNDFESDTLSVYSGSGYIAKSRIASSYSKSRKALPSATGKRPGGHVSKKRARRFNEELDSVSQK